MHKYEFLQSGKWMQCILIYEAEKKKSKEKPTNVFWDYHWSSEAALKQAQKKQN